MDSTDLPRWRGFNLLAKFMADDERRFREEDFEWISELGFDFVRLPMDYRCWTGNSWQDISEEKLSEVDEAVEYGRRHDIHVSLNFHRAPGYTVASPSEVTDLWTEQEPRETCALHWQTFAERYQDLSNEQLSINLVNEPADCDPADYAETVRYLTDAIHAVDPDRLVIADGLGYGRSPVTELSECDVAQSTRGYDPMPVSHFHADWIDVDEWVTPEWPLSWNGTTYDRSWLERERIDPWQALEADGVGVHVGEWGAYNHTDHDVVLDWMESCLQCWKQAGWGWALWNFRGSFGILDSRRSDVTYDDWYGHDLDREMLELLQRY
jgi:endoglucanase